MVSRTGQRPVIAVSASLTWTLGWLLLAIRWRLAPAAWEFAGPMPMSGFMVAWGWLLIPASLVLQSRAGWRPWPWRQALWPALPLILAWLTLPLEGRPHPMIALGGMAMVALGLGMRRSMPAPPPRPHSGWRHGRLWRGVHLVVVALTTLLLVAGDMRPVLISCALYPAYALIQLTLLLAMPWPWLRQTSAQRPWATGALTAGLFASCHWPNPAVMLLTLLGMLFWAREYGTGRPLPALAISMGLMATLVAQGLPTSWTGHMQVGPAAVQQQAVPALASRYRQQATPDAALELRSTAFVRALYPVTVGRVLTEPEAHRWRQAVEFERRCQLIWTMLNTSEARRHRDGDVPHADDPTRHWTAAPAPWPAWIRAQAVRLPIDTSWTTVLSHGYEQVLGRRAAPDELAMWDPDLSQLQYEALTRYVLVRHKELARAPFDTLASEDLLFWR